MQRLGDPRGRPWRTRETQRARLQGGGGGLLPGRDCEQQGRARGQPGFLPIRIRVYRRFSTGSRTGQTCLGRSRAKTVPWTGAGPATSPPPRLLLGEGPAPGVSAGPEQRDTRRLRGSAQAHWDALTYTGAQPGPHRRPAASHGWKPPQGAAGSKRAESLGAERKGWGAGPLRCPQPSLGRICCSNRGS